MTRLAANSWHVNCLRCRDAICCRQCFFFAARFSNIRERENNSTGTGVAANKTKQKVEVARDLLLFFLKITRSQRRRNNCDRTQMKSIERKVQLEFARRADEPDRLLLPLATPTRKLAPSSWLPAGASRTFDFLSPRLIAAVAAAEFDLFEWTYKTNTRADRRTMSCSRAERGLSAR